MAIRAGQWKLVRYDGNADTHSGLHEPATAAKLYNLRDDVGESKDLAAVMPDKVRELQTEWDAWNATLAPPARGLGEGTSGGTPKKNRKRKTKADQ